MKTRINNNKNIKKIITFCLYNVITLSAGIVECCEKGKLPSILNTSEDEKLTLSDMNGIFSFIAAANQQLNIEYKPINPNIPPSDDTISTISAFSDVKKRKIEENLSNLETTEINLKKLKKDENNFSSTATQNKAYKFHHHLFVNKNACVNPNKKLITIEPQYFISKDFKAALEYTELNFSKINTETKYAQIVTELSQKEKTLVRIKCNQPECTTTRSGVIRQAWRAIIFHLKKKHLICKCSRQYEFSEQIKECSCKLNRQKNYIFH